MKNGNLTMEQMEVLFHHPNTLVGRYKRFFGGQWFVNPKEGCMIHFTGTIRLWWWRKQSKWCGWLAARLINIAKWLIK